MSDRALLIEFLDFIDIVEKKPLSPLDCLIEINSKKEEIRTRMAAAQPLICNPCNVKDMAFILAKVENEGKGKDWYDVADFLLKNYNIEKKDGN